MKIFVFFFEIDCFLILDCLVVVFLYFLIVFLYFGNVSLLINLFLGVKIIYVILFRVLIFVVNILKFRVEFLILKVILVLYDLLI